MLTRNFGIGLFCLGFLMGGCGPQDSMETSSKLLALNTSSDRYLVQFKNPGGAAEVKAKNGQVVRDLSHLNAVAAKLPPQAIWALAKSANVDFIEPDPVRWPMAQQVPYGIKMVQGGVADPEDLSTFIKYGGIARGNRKVCIIDTGYNVTHPDLLSTNITFTDQTGSVGGALTDGYGHGTHVAGTILGVNNDIGVVGVESEGNFNLHIVKIFNDAGDWTTASDLIAGLLDCQTNGSHVVSMSLGGDKKSKVEERAFKNAFAQGVLFIAAAGNDGDLDGDPNNIDPYSYPASYDSVVSVGALDENKHIANFSQKNNQVEIAAPGVGVLSTIPVGHGLAVDLVVDGAPFSALGMDGAPVPSSAAGMLVDCGLGDVTCPGASGNVCLIQRGAIAFSDKVLNCQNSGGVGAVIYNNVEGPLAGTMGGVATSIPSVGISMADGATLMTKLGTSASLAIYLSGYDYAAWNGTSMATPHVSGVAALIWSHNPSWTATEIRNALAAGAEDLGAASRDVVFGFGLVQAKESLDYLLNISEPPACTTEICDDGLDNDCDGQIDGADDDCGGSTCLAAGSACASNNVCCSGVCQMLNKKRGKCL